MELSELLRAIGSRGSFAMIKSALKQHGMDNASVGWAGTAARLEALGALGDGEVMSTLFEIYMENVLYTQKAVVLWVVKKNVAADICRLIERFVDTTSPYASAYPLPLPESELRGTTRLGVPTAYEVHGSRHSLLFASKRERIEEQPLDAETMPQELVDAGFTQFYAKKRHVFQVFDSISVIPSLGLIEMRIDQGKSLSEKDVLSFKTGLVNRFNKLVKEHLGYEQLLGQAVNLAPALEPLYKGKDWVVHNIDHQNDAGYSNSNRGRNRTDDVRADHYHSTGEAAVGGVQLWNVRAAFPNTHTAWYPTLALEGHSAMLNSLVPFMDIARILDCSTAAEYDQVFGALLSCLSIV